VLYCLVANEGNFPFPNRKNVTIQNRFRDDTATKGLNWKKIFSDLILF
jgi:hypothetical protein